MGESISKWAETPYEISHARPKNPELEILTSKCILESRTPKLGRFKETDGTVHQCLLSEGRREYFACGRALPNLFYPNMFYSYFR